MDDKLVIVGRFGNSAAAHAARLALDAEGIEAVVGDDAAADMLSIMTPGLGGAKLLVPARHVQRAKAILAHETRHKEPPLPAWTCHECGSTVDAGFAVCWSCGAEYDRRRSQLAPRGGAEEDEDEAPAWFTSRPRRSLEVGAEVEEPEDLPSGPLEKGEWRCPACGLRIDESHTECPACGTRPDGTPNPYVPAHAAVAPADDDADELLPETEEDARMVLHAWRAAIIGLVVCPGVLHLYSLWLLVRVSLSGRMLSPTTNRLFYVTLVIDILSPALILLIWRIFIFVTMSVGGMGHVF
jgi:rubrerythrin